MSPRNFVIAKVVELSRPVEISSCRMGMSGQRLQQCSGIYSQHTSGVASNEFKLREAYHEVHLLRPDQHFTYGSRNVNDSCQPSSCSLRPSKPSWQEVGVRSRTRVDLW